jgi:hypothetical protein
VDTKHRAAGDWASVAVVLNIVVVHRASTQKRLALAVGEDTRMQVRRR